jgi:hypothetical protein
MQKAPGVWDVVALGLGIGSSAAAVIVAVWGLWKLVRRRWEKTVGRRKAQTKILDQLACTVSMAFVEKLLGPPRFIIGDDPSSEERCYRLPGCWIEIVPRGNAVERFSITITDPKMWYRTDGVTLGTIHVRLGVDTFAEAEEDYFDGEQMAPGLKHASYTRHYHFGGAGGARQHFWLSYNAAGAGSIECNGPFASGVFGSFGDINTPPDHARITVNTLAVLSPHAALTDHSHGGFGPHIESVDLLTGPEARAAWAAETRRRRSSERLRRWHAAL